MNPVQLKLKKYFEEYYKVEEINIFEKNYRATRYRGLVMYFLYRENLRRNLKITLSDIATIFKIKSHSTVIHSLKKTELYIKKPILLGKKESLKFSYLAYIFNKILNQKI